MGKVADRGLRGERVLLCELAEGLPLPSQLPLITNDGQLRVFSRDRPLSLDEAVEVVALDSEPLVLSVFDGSLLVYTADNTFHHFLIRHLRGTTPRLRGCGSIGFEGVVADARKVRGLSWLVPRSQRRRSNSRFTFATSRSKFIRQVSATRPTISMSLQSSSSSQDDSFSFDRDEPLRRKSSTTCRFSPTASNSTGPT